MSNSVLALTCACCKGLVEASWNHQPDWAKLSGFGTDCIEWSDNGVHAGEHWLRLDTPPIQGNLYTVKVQMPFTIDSSNQPVWVVWQPAHSSADSWAEFPEKIPQSCLVQIKLQEILEDSKTSAWIRVEVQQVIPFEQLAQILPPREGKDLCPLFEVVFPDGYYKEQSGDWTFISVNAQSNLGSWIVCRQWQDVPVLLLYREWGFHECELYVGHRSLTPEEWQRLTPPELHDANHAY